MSAPVPNAEIAFVQNGRDVTWPEVTTEDLLGTLLLYPESESATFARIEWERRMGVPFDARRYS